MTYRVREVEFDPLLGLRTEWHENDEGEVVLNYKQDAEPLYEENLRIRNDGTAWHNGLKQNMVHAFRIDAGVVMELLGIGVNVYTAPTPDIVAGLKKLNRYEACDMTGKRLVKASHK